MNEAELQKRLASLYGDLNILRAREVKYSGNAPLDLLNRIKDYETAIELVEARLNGEISDEALKKGLEPLILELGSTISVDRSLIKIGTLNIPTWPIVALLVIVVGVWGFLGYTFIGPSEMPLDTFNIAVAEFGQLDEAGNVSRLEDGSNLSEWLFGQLQSSLQEFAIGDVTVWHDSMKFYEKRSKIGIIPGKTAEERRDAAAALAERIGAGIVVYGNLAVDQNPVDFIPEFYVAALRNEADEIVGTQQMGAPIPVRLPINLHDEVTDAFFEDHLGVRVDALAYFTRGLALDQSGRHEDALQVFREAETALPGWRREGQGKEILYYFIGRESLFVGQKQKKPEFLDEAEAAFMEAIDINPDYTRAYIGLGGVYFQRGQQLIDEANRQQQPLDPVVLDDFGRAVEEYQRALTQPSGMLEAQVEFSAALSLGIAYTGQARAYINFDKFAEAMTLADLAADQLKRAIEALSPQRHRIRSQGYLALGGAYQIKAHALVRLNDKVASKSALEQARQAYEQCSQEAAIEPYDATIQEDIKAKCDQNLADVQAEMEKL